MSLGTIAWFLTRNRATKQNFFNHTHQEGEVMRSLGQQGTHYIYQVRVLGEIWKARSETTLVIGDRVKVSQQRGDELLLDVIKS